MGRDDSTTDKEQPKEGRVCLEDVASMGLLQLKAELRRRGDVHPRGDVRRLRAALERKIRTESELSVARQDMLPPCFGELTVTVRSCLDLMPTNAESASPFIVVTLGTEGVKKRTATYMHTLNPEIGEEFRFTIPDYSEVPELESEAQMQERVSRVAAECVLCVVVWAAPNRILESPCFLGEVKIDLVKEFGKEWLTQEISRPFKLSDPDFRSETEHRERRLKARGSHFQDQLELGEIDLAIRFRRKEQTKSWWSGGALDGVLDMASAGLDLTTIFQPKLAVQDEAECTRTCPNGHGLHFRVEDGLIAAERAMLPPCDGVLHVTVFSCSNLLPTDSEDHCSDPYVSVSLPTGTPKLQRTKTIKKTLQPVFDQKLTWKLKATGAVPADLVLSLTVFDAYMVGLASNFLGEAELDLCKFYRKRWLSGKLSKTLHLSDFGREDEGKKLKNDTALDECSKREAMSLRPHGTITLHVEFVATGDTRVSEDNQTAVQSDNATSLADASEAAAEDNLENAVEAVAHDAPSFLPSRSDDRATASLPSTEAVSGVAKRDHKDSLSSHQVSVGGKPGSSLRHCTECFDSLVVGTRLWECAGCNFVLCATCAVTQLDWAGLDNDQLDLRLQQAQQATSTQGFDDSTVLARTRALISRSEQAGINSEAMTQLRANVKEYEENARIASLQSKAKLPLLSPAEARRRKERKLPERISDSNQHLVASPDNIAAMLSSVQSRLAIAKAERAESQRRALEMNP